MRWLPPPGWKRRLAIAVGLVLALRAVLATVIERVAEDQGTRALGVPLRIGDVDLALWRGSIAVEQLRVGRKGQPPDAEEVQSADALLSLERLGVRISWLDLIRGRIRLRELELVSPEVQLLREADGSIAPLPEQPPDPQEQGVAEEASEGGALPLAVDQFALRGARVGLFAAEDPSHELLGFGLEELTLADFSLDQGSIALGAIGVRRPELRVHERLAFGAGDPAPADETPPVGSPPPAEEETAAGGPPAFRIEHIAIERAAFTLQMENSALDLSLALSADGVSAERGHAFPAKLRLEVARGTLEAEGQVGIDPPLFDGALRWQGLAIPVLLEPLPPGPADSLEAATASGDLQISAQLAPPDGSAPEIRVSGSLDLADVAARDPAQGLSLAWKALEVEIDELRAPLAAEGGAPEVALRKLRLVEPSARVVIAKAEVAAEASDAAPASETPPVDAGPAPAQPKVSIASLEIVGGRVDFVDRNVDPEYKAQLRRVALGVRDLRWPEGDLRDLRAGFTGPADAVLDLRGSLDDRAGELQLKIDRLAVAGFNPYARSAAGVEIARGNLSLDTRARASGNAWSLRNDLRLHELSLASGGSANVPSVGLPLSAVLALLRDSRGEIKLSFPVEVEGQLARAGVGSIVMSALRQALVGLVSSPLKVLGLATGSGESGAEQPTALAFAPGSTEPAEGESERIREIAALLAGHPMLGLVLRGSAGEADATPLAEQLLRERIEAGNEPELPGSGFLQRRRLRSALEDRARGAGDELDAEDRAALERWIAATPVPPERTQALAAERAEVLLALLVDMHGIARERLSLADPLEGDPVVALEISSVSGS